MREHATFMSLWCLVNKKRLNSGLVSLGKPWERISQSAMCLVLPLSYPCWWWAPQWLKTKPSRSALMFTSAYGTGLEKFPIPMLKICIEKKYSAVSYFCLPVKMHELACGIMRSENKKWIFSLSPNVISSAEICYERLHAAVM